MKKLYTIFCFVGLLFMNVSNAQSNGGKYIVNGSSYAAEDVIRQLYTFGRQLPDDERRFLSCIQNALRDGQTISYDPLSYSIEGYVNWNSQLTLSQQKSYSKKGALPKDCLRMIYHLAQFQPHSRDPISSLKNNNIDLDMQMPKNLAYMRNADGTLRYFVCVDNVAAISRLEAFRKFSRRNGRIYFKDCLVVEFKGYDGIPLEAYMHWIEDYKDLNGLIARVKNATITDMDKAVLKQVGVFVTIK